MVSPVVQLRVPEATLAAIDSARGDQTRSAWILSAIARQLIPPSAVLTASVVHLPAPSLTGAGGLSAPPVATRSERCPHTYPDVRMVMGKRVCKVCP